MIAFRWLEPRIVLRSCGHPKRTSKSVLVLTPYDEFHETLRTHEKKKQNVDVVIGNNRTFCVEDSGNFPLIHSCASLIG